MKETLALVEDVLTIIYSVAKERSTKTTSSKVNVLNLVSEVNVNVNKHSLESCKTTSRKDYALFKEVTSAHLPAIRVTAYWLPLCNKQF